MADWKAQLDNHPMVRGHMTSKAFSRDDVQRCKSELYETMPGSTPADSLRLLETDRRVLVRQIESLVRWDDDGWVFLYNIARAVTAVRIWVLTQMAGGNVACFEDKYLKLRDWAYRLFTEFGHTSDWAAVDDWSAGLIEAATVEVRNLTAASLDDSTRRRIHRVWVSIIRHGASGSADDRSAFWFRRLNLLPAELLAVVYFWTKQSV